MKRTKRRRWEDGKQWKSELGIRKAEKDKGERSKECEK